VGLGDAAEQGADEKTDQIVTSDHRRNRHGDPKKYGDVAHRSERASIWLLDPRPELPKESVPRSPSNHLCVFCHAIYLNNAIDCSGNSQI